MPDLIQSVSYGDGIAGIVMRRAERRNALSIELLESLSSAVELLTADVACRVVVLSGDGPVFSSGLDLREAADETLIELSAAAVERALRILRHTTLVTIAAVQGGAFAGGAGLMAACDIAVISDDARIGFPEARRGLLPALICDVLRTKVREGDLRDLLLTGEPVDAQRACQLGLAQRVTPSATLMAEALRVARSVVAGGPETIRATKRLLNDVFDQSGKPEAHSLSDWHLEARRSDEAGEGLRAFAEKREPNWHRRD